MVSSILDVDVVVELLQLLDLGFDFDEMDWWKPATSPDAD